jgi:hypothetical protein
MKSTQRLIPIWIWLCLLSAIILFGILKDSFDIHFSMVSYILAGFLGLILSLLALLKLEVEADANEISYTIFPFFSKKTVKKDAIKTLELTKLRLFKDITGYGIRVVDGHPTFIFKGENVLKLHYGEKKVMLGINEIEKWELFLKQNGFMN